MKQIKSQCKLCGNYFTIDEMSDEHYPAKCVGNNDVVALNLVDLVDFFSSETELQKIQVRINRGEKLENIADEIFDKKLSYPIYPNGRTVKSLCRKCNTFLGKYDEAYLKFYKANGEPSAIKGFQKNTKLQIIKSIFGKFISLPEASKENFDFIEFIRDESLETYSGKWKIYFLKRDLTTDLMSLPDIRTGKLTYDEGVVYELSDDKFIFNLMNFEKPTYYKMTNIFDIMKNDYVLVQGFGPEEGYHAELLISQILKNQDPE